MTDVTEAAPPARRGSLRRGLLWGSLTGALVAIVDTVDTGLAGFDGSLGYLAWYTASALVFAFGSLGGALALWTRAVGWALPRASGKLRSTARAFLLGLPGALFVAWVPTSWITENWPRLATSGRAIACAVYVLAFAGSTLIAWTVERAQARWRAAHPGLPRAHPFVLALSVLVAALAYWADRRILVDLYEDFHYGLAGAFVALVGLFAILLTLTVAARAPVFATRATRHAGRALALILGSSFLSLCVLEQLSPDVFGPSSSVIFTKLVGTVRNSSDFDGDGASNLLGGTDCGPFDAAVLPGQFDMPGNGLDEDCSGTSAEWPKPEPEPTYPVPDAAGYNVLMISVDALRADHIGAYGYTERPTTPNIDRLARRSVMFTEAFSPAPKTYDAMPCLATGLYPSNVPRDYRVKTEKGQKKRAYLYQITNEVRLLSEVLRERGYATGAAHVSILRSLGLDRGFDDYQITRTPSDMALDFLQRRVALAEKPPPFYLWLHYYSPHHSYEKRPGFDFGDSDVERYDSEIAHDDHQIGRVLDALDEHGLSARTVVIFTADHGEEFRDHGGTQHGLRLYRELTRVPLLLVIPGLEPRAVDAPVELADVAPTLCQVLRLGPACGEHDGHSLIAALEGKRSPERGAYAELYRKGDLLLMNAISTGKWRLIYDYKKDRAQLYDLATDRTEQHNVARQHPELVQELRDRMATRTLYRQGLVFQQYTETKDSLVLARALPVFRRTQMLDLALDRIEEDLGSRHVRYLKTLLKRPGLDPQLKKRTKGLIERAQALRKHAGNDAAKRP